MAFADYTPLGLMTFYPCERRDLSVVARCISAADAAERRRIDLQELRRHASRDCAVGRRRARGTMEPLVFQDARSSAWLLMSFALLSACLFDLKLSLNAE